MCAVSRPLFASPVSQRSIRIWLGQTDQWQPSVITLIPLCFNKTQPNFQLSRSWVEQDIEKKELSLSFIFSSATMERCNNDQYLATLCVVTALRRMSRSPGLMGSIDVRQRERVTQFTGQRHAMSGIRGSEVWLLWHSSDVTWGVGQCHYGALSWTLWPELNAQHQATKGLDSYLLSQFKSWMLFGTTTIPSLSPTTAPCSWSGWTQIVRPDTEVMG